MCRGAQLHRRVPGTAPAGAGEETEETGLIGKKTLSVFDGKWLVLVSLLLAACAPAQPQRVWQGETSVILASVEVFPDFVTPQLARSTSDIYQLNLRLAGSAENESVIGPLPALRNQDTQSRWLAFPVRPGVYGLAGIIEEGNEGRFQYNQPVKSTMFTGPGEMPLFEVGPNEVVYIGSFRARLGTNFGTGLGQLGGRVLRDARKIYALDTARARQALRAYRLSEKPFRQVNVFSKSPGAYARYQELWAARPTDHERVEAPVNRDDIIERANDGLEILGE